MSKKGLLVAHYVPECLHNVSQKFSPAGTNFIDKLRVAWDDIDLCILKIKSNNYENFSKEVLGNLSGNSFVLNNLNDFSYYENIWFYNVPNLKVLFLALFIKLSGKRIYLVNADFSRNSLLGKVLIFTRHMWDGIISLSHIGDLGHSNSLVLPGIYRPRKGIIRKTEEKNVIFSGLLTRRHGVDLLVEIADMCVEYKFHVTGYGLSDTDRLKLLTKVNIVYHGYMTRKDYEELLSNCEYALSLRNPSYPENEGEFPSKIFEFLENGLRVVATGIDDRYNLSKSVCNVHFNVNDVANALKSFEVGVVNDFDEDTYGYKAWRRKKHILESYA